jgi:hypothetical protein
MAPLNMDHSSGGEHGTVQQEEEDKTATLVTKATKFGTFCSSIFKECFQLQSNKNVEHRRHFRSEGNVLGGSYKSNEFSSDFLKEG